MSRGRKRGFSLMEVLLAISILLASLIVLGQMAYVGRQHARSAEQIAWAQILCRSLMAERLAGAAPVTSSPWQPVPGHADWQYAVEVAPQGSPGVVAVTVTVSEGAAGELLEGSPGRGKSFRLTRWMYRPDDAAESTPEAEPEIPLDLFD